MKKLFVILALLTALLVIVSCDSSIDHDNFIPIVGPTDDPKNLPLTLEFRGKGKLYLQLEEEQYYQEFTGAYYELNGGERTEFKLGDTIEVSKGDIVTLYRRFLHIPGFGYCPLISIQCTADCFIYGNITSMIYVDKLTEYVAEKDACKFLFKGNTHIKLRNSSDFILSPTTLEESCYEGMFMNCTGLDKAPVLSSNTLAPYCYKSMFEGCVNLKEAPALPAHTKLEKFCYWNMFKGCSSLEKAPELPAEKLAEGCYNYMFYNCSKLNSISCNAKDITEHELEIGTYTLGWIDGVSSSGVFYRNADCDVWKVCETQKSGIPSGWTVKDNQ